MLGWLQKKLKKLQSSPFEDPALQLPQEDLEQKILEKDLDVNLQRLKDIMGESQDLVFREFRLGVIRETKAAVIYIESMVDEVTVQQFILRPLMVEARTAPPPNRSIKYMLDQIKEQTLTVADVKEATRLGQMVDAVLSGNTVLLIADQTTGLIAETKAWEGRQPEEPTSEAAVRGPREGFTETLQTNVAMLRRRLKTSRLRFEHFTIGRLSRTDVVMVYIKGITEPKIVDEVRQRLNRIDIDAVLESGYLEELIEDHPTAIFSLVTRTERPDKVAAALLEGRVAIITANTPFVLLVPRLLIEGLQASEDYYERYVLTVGVRVFRYIAIFISMLLPSLYVAITTFHQEMLPTAFLISIAGQREGVPFPAVAEALLMEGTFEILREAGIRLPKQVGPAISIVGALVIGDAAVRAGIVSPVMVIVVAMTAIASFTTPAYDLAITMRMIRLPMVVLAGTLGLFGVMAGLLAVLIHACTLTSFGVSYTAPLAPMIMADQKDVVVRVPWWAMATRPRLLGHRNRRRQEIGRMPGPPEGQVLQKTVEEKFSTKSPGVKDDE